MAKQLVALLVVACSVKATLGGEDRHVVFKYEVEVRDIPRSARTVDVWLPIPPETDEQEILSLRITASVNGEFVKEPKYGNRVWHGRFDARKRDRNTRDRAPIGATMSVELIRREQAGRLDAPSPQAVRLPSYARFLQPNRLVPITDRFTRIAKKAIGSNPSTLEQARLLYDYVLDRMAYDKSGTKWGRGDANYACDVGKGNCSDYHSLFIALSRSAGIPSRFWIGFPLPPKRGRSNIGGYHCWAEFFVEGAGWIPVDISEADKHADKRTYFFGKLDENRIALMLGRDLTLPGAQQDRELNFFIDPYVEVDGKPFDRTYRRKSVEDLPQSPRPRS